MLTVVKRASRPAVRITEEQLDAVFEQAESQGEALVSLYTLVLPDWDEITSIDGWPSVNERTWKGIAQRFINLDRVKHPDCMAGGLWLNRGFATSHGETLRDGVVSFKGVAITTKGD